MCACVSVPSTFNIVTHKWGCYCLESRSDIYALNMLKHVHHMHGGCYCLESRSGINIPHHIIDIPLCCLVYLYEQEVAGQEVLVV